MSLCRGRGLGVLALALVGSAACAPDGPVPCADLASFESPGVVIDSAGYLRDPEPQTNPYDGQPMPPLAPHCEVSGTIDGEIRFELRLPSPDSWNGRFAMGGGGGFVGSVINSLLFPAPGAEPVLDAGYATVGTDTGHRGSTIDASWALDAETRERNFADRAVHLVAETSERIIRRHYGRPADYSYFVGCSRGGGQAMIASQRYPSDFDGIVAAAPAFSWPALGADLIENTRAMYPDPNRLDAPVVTAENRALLEREILKACDGLDGVEDGLLTDPRACDFDPAALPRCAGAPGPDCLTPAQLAAIQTIYRGPEVDGERLIPGFPFGGENDPGGWDAWITGGPGMDFEGSPTLHHAFGTQIYKYLIFDDPEFDYSTYDFEGWHEDVAAADALLSAKDADLSAFRDAGGRILFWHGWSDPALSALATIEYFESLQRETADAADFARLFMLPGVLHCGGGPGADAVDWLALIADWVENDRAPDRIVARKLAPDGTTAFARALCPYPEVATYDGEGDPADATSYACALPPAPARPDAD